MGKEIERKFLVNKERWEKVPKRVGERYRQGYLLTEPTKTIRVRLTETSGYLTLKGLTVGATRPEYEYEIPKSDAAELLDNFSVAELSKIRYKIPVENHVWEVDEFLGENDGLIIAEIELDSEEEPFTRPDWVGQEVTTEKKYYNANLTIHPFKTWKT